MVAVAERSRRLPVEQDEAGSTPVGHPNEWLYCGNEWLDYVFLRLQYGVHGREAEALVRSPKPRPAGSTPATVAICPNCASAELAKVKGCVRCLRCGFKEDCNGW